MLHIHDHGQLLGTTLDTNLGADASDTDDEPPNARQFSRRRRAVDTDLGQGSLPLRRPLQPLNALESLAAWQRLSLQDMAQRLCAMSESERTQLRTDYVMAEGHLC